MKNRYGFGENVLGNSSVSNLTSAALKGIVKTLPLRVLSAIDFEFWQHNGYVIIKNAVSSEAVAATVGLLWEFEEMDPTDSKSWYRPQLWENKMQELNNSGMVECYNNQVLWNNRQNPRVYDAFVDLWDREDLWVTIDRANLNPPNRHGRDFSGFIHWDADTSLTLLPVNVQGVLALSDTTLETGGFQCVPALYRDLEQWRLRQPAERDPFVPDLNGYETEFVPMKAGELLIWNCLQPHGVRPNKSETVRLAQYISMVPAEEKNETIREWRTQSWTARIAPDGYAFPGDPRNWEQTRYPKAELSTLGEKLLGSQSWNL
ncbi:MAG: phytanoyl-CoA dioxygenase family protein [SAR324 cluster bacterium]|nr:phytanoyl-CoA dioxygenase family protein [SAR324 cluster bacterium]